MKPLEGIKVIDLTHMLAGPYAGMVIADLGAEVVKVEPLDTGEMTRGLLAEDPNNSFKGFGAYFLTLNRNKKSLSLDLKNQDGLNVFYDLVKTADVVLNNFSAGVVKKLKIDFEHLRQINPKIIFRFVDAFPISLQGLDFEISTGSTEYMQGVAMFKYSYYQIETL